MSQHDLNVLLVERVEAAVKGLRGLAENIRKAVTPAPNCPRCKTCKWWMKPPGRKANSCCNPLMNDSLDTEKGALPDGMCSDADIFTGPAFGCVHHEKREEKPDSAAMVVAELRKHAERINSQYPLSGMFGTIFTDLADRLDRLANKDHSG